MLDINRIRKEADAIKKNLSRRNPEWVKSIDEVIKLDKKYRDLLTQTEKLSAQRNAISKDVAKAKAAKDEQTASKLQKEVASIKTQAADLDKQATVLAKELKEKMLGIPNLPHESVPTGKDETENKEVHKWSEPTKFDFKPKAHWDLAVEDGLVDFERAVKLTGTRFTCYTKYGAKLIRALIQYTLDSNSAAGFQEMLPAVILNANSLTGTGQLPKFEEDLFKLTNGYYLSPTAEVQLTNYFGNEILPVKKLPIRFTANTCCFRSEAGSAGKDTKGVIRQHQFYKTEMVILSNPKDSYEQHEYMTRQAEKLLEGLKLPYRRIVLCTGDMGFGSCKTYDIEVWLPSYNSYKEISSCSNCEDFQARRMMLRYKDEDGQNKYVHTLNGSGLAIDRLWAAVVENYQQKDGSIKVPEPLQKYMNGLKVIPHEDWRK
ncbi:MAG: serine--tRNA ligase [Mycoplasma sp.]|nr:serine--tRNA ligase [Candidatus Hennigella equi]